MKKFLILTVILIMLMSTTFFCCFPPIAKAVESNVEKSCQHHDEKQTLNIQHTTEVLCSYPEIVANILKTPSIKSINQAFIPYQSIRQENDQKSYCLINTKPHQKNIPLYTLHSILRI